MTKNNEGSVETITPTQRAFDSAACAEIESRIGMYLSVLAGGGQALSKWHLRSLERYVENCPHDLDGLTEVAQLHFEIGNFDKASYYFSRALIICPHNETVIEALCISLMKSGRVDEGINLYGVFLRNFPGNIKSVLGYYQDLGQNHVIQSLMAKISPDFLPERIAAHMNVIVNNEGLASENRKK